MHVGFDTITIDRIPIIRCMSPLYFFKKVYPYATQRVDILPGCLCFEEIRPQSYHNAISHTEI